MNDKVVSLLPEREHSEDDDTPRIELCDGLSVTGAHILILQQRGYLTDDKAIELLRKMCMRQRRELIALRRAQEKTSEQ